jgi:predicted ATP-dependent endonuclease of OLD family
MMLQTKSPKGRSEFTLVFDLSFDERKLFAKQFGVNLSKQLKIRTTLGNHFSSCNIVVGGPAKLKLEKQKDDVLSFITDRISLQYIPAIRTTELAVEHVKSLLADELSILENDKQFQEHLKKIEEYQQPIIDSIASSLNNTISEFIPDVKGVQINYKESYARRLGMRCEIMVDDGTETSLNTKGDGIISLTAIALLRYINSKSSSDKRIILLLEEPESHLHPKAIHNLKKVLKEISDDNQIVISTHSPIMIDRSKYSNNILIQSGSATKVQSIKEIRDSLGIVVSDNLVSAEIMVLVEGECDQIIIETWLKGKSAIITNAIKDGRLAFDNLGGASNLSYKAGLYKTLLCDVVAYLDNDESGRKAIKTALAQGTITNDSYFLSTCKGSKDSEIEDLIKHDTYFSIILEEYGIDLNTSSFRGSGLWSQRMRSTFRECGKIGDDFNEKDIKILVAKAVEDFGIDSLNEPCSGSINEMVKLLESKLR